MKDDLDPISLVLQHLRLKAQIFQHASYCGRWAVDTSGGHMVPFHLIQKGRSWLHLEQGDTKITRELVSGDMVVLPHDATHTISTMPEGPSSHEINVAAPVALEDADNIMLCGYFRFDSKASWPILQSLPPAIILNPRNHRFSSLVEIIFDELDAPQPGTKAVLESVAVALFVHVLRAAVAEGVNAGVLSALLDPKLASAFALIHGSTQAEVNVDKLAAASNMSKSAFAERFRSALGESPMRYLQRWRLQVALDLLQSTSDTVANIADQVGYSAEVSFRQAFRKELGMTPSAARRLART